MDPDAIKEPKPAEAPSETGEKKVSDKANSAPTPPTPTSLKKKMRQIIIETDGDSVNMTKAETAGSIETVGVLQILIDFLKAGGK